MDVKAFTYLAAVFRHGTYARAARDVGITPQGLSSAVARMEKELDAPLVDASSGVLVPTAYGRLVLGYADQIDGSLRGIHNGIETIRAHESNLIRLGCATGLLGYLGEETVAEYNASSDDSDKGRHRPQVLVSDELPDLVCQQRLIDGEYDLCLMTNPVDNPEIIAVPIVDDYQFLWVSRRNPLSRRSSLEPKDLDGQTVILMNDEYKGTHAMIRLVSQMGVNVAFKYTSEMMRVYETARLGKALGLTCRNHIEATSDSSVTVGVPFKALPWGISACYRRDAALSEAQLDFLDYLRSLTRTYK